MVLCPSCPTSEMVQAIVLDDRFWTHLLVVLLPLLLMAMLAAVVYGVALRRREA